MPQKVEDRGIARPAWISTLGTAAAMEDLDGDGLPNDLIYSEPRTDLVTVAPVPGTLRKLLFSEKLKSARQGRIVRAGRRAAANCPP